MLRKTRNRIGAAVATIVTILVVGGYVANIFKLIEMWSGTITTEAIVRLVGIFAFPLGAIAGYF